MDGPNKMIETLLAFTQAVSEQTLAKHGAIAKKPEEYDEQIAALKKELVELLEGDE